jgi:dynein heavy chain
LLPNNSEKTYNETSLREDLKLQFQKAGHKGKPIAFIFTENEIKDEVFLESFSYFLSTGEVPGFFTKEEMLAMAADSSQAFRKERPGLDETIENLKQFYHVTSLFNLESKTVTHM